MFDITGLLAGAGWETILVLDLLGIMLIGAFLVWHIKECGSANKESAKELKHLAVEIASLRSFIDGRLSKD